MRSAAWGRKDWVLAAVAAIVAAAPRALVRTPGVFDIDSALLTLGVQSFDFADYHPHPPYHPLTMAAAKLLAPWTGPADALVWVSLAAVAVLGFCVYAIGRILGDRLVGSYAAAVLALSPLLTENAGVALSYANEPAALAVVALVALRARRRNDLRSWLLLGVAASIAVGVRPSAAIVAGPLVLWAARRDLKALGSTAAAGAVATLVWFPATLWAGGGWERFRFGNRFQTDLYVLHDPVWTGGAGAVRNNLAWMAHHLHSELAWLGAVGLLTTMAALPLLLRRSPDRWFLLAWGGPLLLFYGLVYGGWPSFHSGYAVGLVPPALVAAALVLRRVQQIIMIDVGDRPLRVAACIVLAAIAAMPLAWPGTWDEHLQERRDTHAWAASWEGLEDALPPERTALIGGYSAHWAMVDHPDYLVWVIELAMADNGSVYMQVAQWQDGRFDKPYFDNIRDGAVDEPHPVPAGIQEIAFVTGHPIEDGFFPLTKFPVARTVTLAGGAQVAVFDARNITVVEDGITNWGVFWPHPSDRVWPPGDWD